VGRKAGWSAEIGLGIAALCLAVLFAWLGFWQIGRAAEKEALASAAAVRARLPAGVSLRAYVALWRSRRRPSA
jgi:cytochrome oxidase assembly protein ShyY1